MKIDIDSLEKLEVELFGEFKKNYKEYKKKTKEPFNEDIFCTNCEGLLDVLLFNKVINEKIKSCEDLKKFLLSIPEDVFENLILLKELQICFNKICKDKEYCNIIKKIF